jgi:hypothetical protein
LHYITNHYYKIELLLLNFFKRTRTKKKRVVFSYTLFMRQEFLHFDPFCFQNIHFNHKTLFILYLSPKMLRDERERLKKGKEREFLVNHVLATQKSFKIQKVCLILGP